MTETQAMDNPVDKNNLYGKFEDGQQRERDNQDKRSKLYLKAAHKALDIAEDKDESMDIQANRTTNNNNGLGVKELIFLATMLTGTGIGGATLMSYLSSREQPQEIKAQGDDQDTLFNLEFADPKETN